MEWLKEFVEIRVKPEKLAHLLTMGGIEVEAMERLGRETIFELGITPNRGDCLSMTGVAREVAAISRGRLKQRKYAVPRGAGKLLSLVKVSVKNRGRCLRYTARAIEGVKIGPSPSWMAARLAACGIRSINNVVDATNYVMIETGQPLHAFDLAKVRGGRIEVSPAEEGRAFTTLDGVARLVEKGDLLIRDGVGPVALAGIMGGGDSEVSHSTKSILLESACFEGAGIRRTARRLGLASESSRRFERGVDPNGVLAALHRVTELILETAGGTPTADWADVYPAKALPKRIALSEGLVRRILGEEIPAASIAKLLARVGLSSGRPVKGRVSVLVPTFRQDITRPIDLIEEVARIYGYDSLDGKMPEVRMSPIVRPRFMEQEDAVREALAGAGMTEAVLYGFVDERTLAPFAGHGPLPVRITNPLSQDQGVMCTTLLAGLLDVARLNASRQRADLKIFALQHVYHRPAGVGPSDEPRSLAGLLTGRRNPEAWERSKERLDFYDAKGVVETGLEALGLTQGTIYQRGEPPAFLHPGRFAYVLCGNSRVGVVGQLHPDVASKWDLEQDVFVFELHFDLMAEKSQAVATRFRELSRFPFVQRDIAIVVEERIPLVEVEKAIQESGVELLDGVNIFDIYRGQGLKPGHRSIAISLRFSREDRTLTDDEVVAAQQRIMAELSKRLKAELRE
ncbi:MAG: phenylalanine--tRNA ligase subunit beta [bacterium]